MAGNSTNTKGKAMSDNSEATVRIPARFFGDHEGRCCEPFCSPVRRTERFVWLKLSDEGIDELLDDAKHYATHGLLGEWARENRGLIKSAKATVKAIKAAGYKTQ